MRPLFIAIEGLDGSGGTTQTRLLQDWLRQQGHQVHLTMEPSEGSVGRFIRQALNDSTPEGSLGDNVLPYLFAADRRDHLDREILPTLASGAFVITDRYYHSSLAYQGLSIGMSRVAELNAAFRAPDITFFLYLNPEISFERVRARGLPVERFETLDRLRTVAEAYHSVLIHCKNNGEHIVTLDANKSITEIHNEIVGVLQPIMDNSEG